MKETNQMDALKMFKWRIWNWGGERKEWREKIFTGAKPDICLVHTLLNNEGDVIRNKISLWKPNFSHLTTPYTLDKDYWSINAQLTF